MLVPLVKPVPVTVIEVFADPAASVAGATDTTVGSTTGVVGLDGTEDEEEPVLHPFKTRGAERHTTARR